MGVPLHVGVVISTLGRSVSLNLLFESLLKQTHKPVQVVVVDQGEGTTVSSLVEKWQGVLPIVRITTPRGVSIGRNAGWRAITGCDVIAFPDDDCSYEPSAFARAVAVFEQEHVDAISGKLQGTRQRVAFTGPRCEIDRTNVWSKAIEATMFFSTHALAVTGGFDESLGLGAKTMWQSGEGTDILLRLMKAGGRALFEPAIVVTEHQVEISQDRYTSKARAYGRGTGRVYRMHYGPLRCAAVVAKPLFGAAYLGAKGMRSEALAKVYAALGRVEGMSGFSGKR